jgi:hypothetical protein
MTRLGLSHELVDVFAVFLRRLKGNEAVREEQLWLKALSDEAA